MMPHRTPFFLPALFPSLYWRVPARENEIYLTFDDGPVPGVTEFVLETLHACNVVATFFCIGDNVRKHPHIYQKLWHAGHKIGNHTFHHLNGWRTSCKLYVDDIAACDAALMDHKPAELRFGRKVFRPPYGKITPSQIRALNDYAIVMWDVLSMDFNRHLSPERALKNTIRCTRRGSIVVFHDSYKAERSLLYSLPRYVDHFLSAGYQFKIFNV
jgi:peptidoglycan-N-acetylglucosamine deacetylase